MRPVIDAEMNDMDDIFEQLARRDHYRRRLNLAKTPEQRMAEMAKLQQQAWETLRSNPAGYGHFMRRNFRERAIRTRQTLQSDHGQ